MLSVLPVPLVRSATVESGQIKSRAERICDLNASGMFVPRSIEDEMR